MEAYDINDLIEFLRFPSISADTQFKPQIEACADWLMKTNANSAASLEPSTHAEDFASNSSRAAFLPVRNYWSKRFLIVPLLSTFALLTPTVSLAQQPTTMSAKSVAKLPFSSGLELDPARAWESSRTHVAGRVEVLFWSSVESPLK